MSKAKIILDDDVIQSLSAGSVFTIGKQNILIEPLTVALIFRLVQKLKKINNILIERGLIPDDKDMNDLEKISQVGGGIRDGINNIKNVSSTGDTKTISNTAEFILGVLEIILTEFPDVMEDLTNIDKDSIQKLPIDIVMGLILECINVNKSAWESLVKNFQSLTPNKAVKNPKKKIQG